MASSLEQGGSSGRRPTVLSPWRCASWPQHWGPEIQLMLLVLYSQYPQIYADIVSRDVSIITHLFTHPLLMLVQRIAVVNTILARCERNKVTLLQND